MLFITGETALCTDPPPPTASAARAGRFGAPLLSSTLLSVFLCLALASPTQAARDGHFGSDANEC